MAKAQVFSYSKLSCVNQCELQYVLRYVDKIYPKELNTSVEQFVGICVHKVVEMDHKNEIPAGPTAHWEVFNELFKRGYSPKRIYDVRDRGLEHWRGLGMKCVSNYLRRGRLTKNWDTVQLEVRKGMPLLDSPLCTVMGILDRLVMSGTVIEIHDFKSGKVKSQKAFAADHQLPLYAAFVAHETQDDRPITVRRVNLQTSNIQTLVVDKDRRHEALSWAANSARRALVLEEEYLATQEAEANQSILCSWCVYKAKLCPVWQGADEVV